MNLKMGHFTLNAMLRKADTHDNELTIKHASGHISTYAKYVSISIRGDRVWLSSVLVVTFSFLSISQPCEPCAIITLMLNHVSLSLCLPDVL